MRKDIRVRRRGGEGREEKGGRRRRIKRERKEGKGETCSPSRNTSWKEARRGEGRGRGVTRKKAKVRGSRVEKGGKNRERGRKGEEVRREEDNCITSRNISAYTVYVLFFVIITIIIIIIIIIISSRCHISLHSFPTFKRAEEIQGLRMIIGYKSLTTVLPSITKTKENTT